MRSVIRHAVNWSLVVAQRATSYPPPPHRVTRVQDAPDHRAPIIETLEPVNLSDELDLVVAGVREHDMSLKVGTWSQLADAAIACKELLDGHGLVVPDPVAAHGIVRTAAFAICEFDLKHPAQNIASAKGAGGGLPNGSCCWRTSSLAPRNVGVL